MPMSKTAIITALRPGLAMKATWICLCRTKAISPPRMTNTSIRSRKMRGLDNLSGSTSLAMIAQASVRRVRNLRFQYATDRRQAKIITEIRVKPAIELKLRPSAPGPPASGFARRFEQPQNFFVHGVVAGKDVTLGVHVLAAVAI